MKIPRDLSGEAFVKKLRILGYYVVRQKGSHIRLTTEQPSEHHITIPNHDPLKVGTLSAMLSDIAEQQGISKEELVLLLFS
jgi:predicted RNA binding protein YcfA (HicA-like mRNA interferase family)